VRLRGPDGVTYSVFEHRILGKEVAAGASSRRLPLGLSSRMTPEAARAHLAARGIRAEPETVDGVARLEAPICGGGGAGALIVLFDAAGRMQTLMHNLEL